MNCWWSTLVFQLILLVASHQYAEAYEEQACTNKGGVCRHPNDCGGYTDKHLCPEQFDLTGFVCCNGTYQEPECKKKGGSCQEKSKCVGGPLGDDLCPQQQSKDIVCCKGTYQDRRCADEGGECRYKTECVGYMLESDCSTKSKDLVCCINEIKQEEQCKKKGGYCLHESRCVEHIRPELCPEQRSEDIACCIGAYQEEQCEKKGGTCVNTDNCGGTTKAKLCPRQLKNILCCFGPYQEQPCANVGGTCRNASDCKSVALDGDATERLCYSQSKHGDVVCCPNGDQKVYKHQNGLCFINKCEHEDRKYCYIKTVVCPVTLTTISKENEIFEDQNGRCYYTACDHFTGNCHTNSIACRSLPCAFFASLLGLDKQMECGEVYLRAFVTVIIAILLLFLKQIVKLGLKYIMNLGLSRFFPEGARNIGAPEERVEMMRRDQNVGAPGAEMMRRDQNIGTSEGGIQMSLLREDGPAETTDATNLQAGNSTPSN